ncbi:PASTA domain-containing protein [Paraglaciecola sp. 20A4]|uniref:PASTA domain-containing protein n=1 Tax=Paraglaciecola sp. 20A4 TaxID=2687288 RepID=UPI001408CA88|nr:PASTA domain-containing protein [Paraglaciecola sp. 20A4]|tara:strand:- start:1484 stop:2101 length:618 start_codon:yes stop_codon:yes gene_type:complete
MATFSANKPSLLSSTQTKSLITGIQGREQANTIIPAARNINQPIFVDLDDKPAIASVVRGGFKVPSVLPDNARLEAFLSGLQIREPTREPRVLDQNIAAGTRVSVGTEVDLILAPREDINIGIFDDIHIDVKDTSIGELLDRVKDQNDLRGLVLKYENANDVEENDKVILTDMLGQFAGININEGKPGQGFSNAFNSVRVALAFK